MSLLLKQVSFAEHHAIILCDQSTGRLRPLPNGKTTHSPDMLYTLILEALVVSFSNLHKLVIFNVLIVVVRNQIV